MLSPLGDKLTEFSEYSGEIPEEYYEYPFLTKRNAFLLLSSERDKRGVVQECCVKSCMLAELQSYCR